MRTAVLSNRQLNHTNDTCIKYNIAPHHGFLNSITLAKGATMYYLCKVES